MEVSNGQDGTIGSSLSSTSHYPTRKSTTKTFFCTYDYRYYVELIAEYAQQAITEIWAYCLMPNHVHMVMVPSTEDGLRATLDEAHRYYTRHINFRQNWRGHLWQERFHSFAMDENYLMATVRYVERNPVVANLCKFPESWPWSSARAHIKVEDDALVKVEPMLARVDNWKAYLSDTFHHNNKNLIKQHLRTRRPLGNSEFVSKLEMITGQTLVPGRPGPKPGFSK